MHCTRCHHGNVMKGKNTKIKARQGNSLDLADIVVTFTDGADPHRVCGLLGLVCRSLHLLVRCQRAVPCLCQRARGLHHRTVRTTMCQNIDRHCCNRKLTTLRSPKHISRSANCERYAASFVHSRTALCARYAASFAHCTQWMVAHVELWAASSNTQHAHTFN